MYDRHTMTNDLQCNFFNELDGATSLQALDDLRVRYFGKQGLITEALKSLGKMSPDERKVQGATINIIRDACQTALNTKKNDLEDAALTQKLAAEAIDVTLPSMPVTPGTHHLISQTTNAIIHYFERFGFSVEEGPDLDDEEHNFNALNIPDHHPARQNHDTFYIDSEKSSVLPLLLRTHTSTVQIRTMRTQKPPLRVLAPGRVYRADYDGTHLPMFHQMEGFIVEEGIHVGHLKSCLVDFCKSFFGKDDLKTRFRPSFFPFTEPSFEMDIWGDERWLEVLGCGIIHPNVLRHVGLDPEVHQGFAFGMGIERFAMLKHNVTDIRNFVEGDLRWNRAAGIPPALAV